MLSFDFLVFGVYFFIFENILQVFDFSERMFVHFANIHEQTYVLIYLGKAFVL